MPPGRKGSRQLAAAALHLAISASPFGGGSGRSSKGGPMSSGTQASGEQDRDSEDLARFGYSQELKRSLGLFSSFAVAFSYISPSTGIFTLFALGLTTLGGVFIWTWPVVALGQFIIALNFAEVTSHYPVAGSVFQWTKYLSTRTYSWFTGWIYLFAGILTVAGVVATVPLVLIPLLNNLGLTFGQGAGTTCGCIGTDADTLRNVAALVLLSTTLL